MKLISPYTYLSLILLSLHLISAQQACFRAKTPFKSQCALPDLWQLQKTLCSSEESWGEGFPFLSGHGLALHMQDNCTADNAPLGIDLYMTISTSTLIKDRADCWNRTYHIIEDCVVDGAPEFNGGEWYDLIGDEETFIWMQYLHIDPPLIPDPYYNESDEGKKGMGTSYGKRFAGTYLNLDREGKILSKRHIES